ncbi:MAG TPA: hypothetical protein ENK91_11310, partial [Bacteroidetes bacterium]|nr:hypothetical protein [Bacteroidota bacterium]
MKNIFSILLVFYLFVLNGQQEVVYAPYYSFDIYSTQNGLSNNRINTIIQDNEGYFWIGTENGLNKFDGYEFTQYFSDAQDSLSISGNIICAISIDNKGNVWVGSDGGLDIYDNIINGFNHVYPFSGDSIAKTAKFVRAIYCENDSILWFDTADGKLHKYHQQNHSEQAFQHKIPSQIHTYYYHQLFDDGEGNIWIGGRGMDPCKFNKKTKIFTYYKANPDDDTRKRDRDVTKYYIDKKGVFWVAGVDGLYVFNKETEVFLKYLNGSTFDLIDFDKDELWISNGKGIKILKRTNKKLYSITHNEENKKSLPSNYVFDFYKDNAGNLWIGTLEGLCKYSPYKNKFQTAFHVFSDDKTLSSDNITSILQTEGGEIWVGTKNNGIDILNEDFLKTDHYDISENSKYRLASNRVSKLFQDKNGNIYIGLWAGVGFDFIESKTSELYHFSLNSESQKLDWYNDFCDDTNGDVLIGTWGSYSVAKFDHREKKFVDKPLKPAPFINKLGSHFVNCLLQNSNGDLFVGTSNKGLSIYNQNSGNFKNFSGLETDSTKLWGQNIRCIFKDTKDNIWIGAKGLNKYNSIDESIEHFTKKNGLCDDGVQAILEDEDGNLWISTLNGLSKF